MPGGGVGDAQRSRSDQRHKKQGRCLRSRTLTSVTRWTTSPQFQSLKSNGMGAYYNICTDPGLGLGFAAFCRVVCGYNVCKEQLTRPWTWMPHVDMHEQTRYAANEECVLWRSYEGVNDWRICELLPAMDDDERGAQDLIRCILNAMEVCMLLMIREGEVRAVGTTDNVAMGYYVSSGRVSCMLCKQSQSECRV